MSFDSFSEMASSDNDREDGQRAGESGQRQERDAFSGVKAVPGRAFTGMARDASGRLRGCV
jgi:hypothetical protein